jgi:hypothetical protein
MVDTIAILITHALILYTIYRAVKLDQTLPWFGPEDSETDTTTPSDDRRNRSSK